MTATDERAALYDSILDAPDDDLPRLVFADWLEEYGDGNDRLRAEFIRVQIALTRLDPYHLSCTGTKCPVCSPLRRRAKAILHDAVRWWGWLMDVYRITGASAIADLDHCSEDGTDWGVRFRRGFLAEVRAPFQTLLDHGPAVLAAHPVTKVVASDRQPQHYHNNGKKPLYGWWRSVAAEANVPNRHILPECLWDLVAQAEGVKIHESWADFDSNDAGADALSLALLTHLRPQAEQLRKA